VGEGGGECLLVDVAWLRVPEPILARQPLDPRELPGIVGHHGEAERLGMRRDQQVVPANRRPGQLKLGPEYAVDLVRGRLERHHLEGAEFPGMAGQIGRLALLPIGKVSCHESG